MANVKRKTYFIILGSREAINWITKRPDNSLEASRESYFIVGGEDGEDDDDDNDDDDDDCVHKILKSNPRTK